MEYTSRLIQDYKDDPTFDYVGDNILFAFSVNNIPDTMIDTRMQFELAFYCSKGKFQSTMDDKQYKVEAGQMLIYPEDWTISEFLASSDAEITIIGYTWDIIESSKSINVALWPMVDYVMDNAVINIGDDYNEWLKYFMPHLEKICKSDNTLLKSELIETLSQSLLYEFIRTISSEMRSATPQDQSRSGEIKRMFFDILASRRGKIRSVSDVAELMNISPKYLSRVIKASTGEKPMHFIHEYTMKAIDRELRYTDKSIKEIAFQQRFPSLAFFGKFVKQQTGMSPTEYRENIKKEVPTHVTLL